MRINRKNNEMREIKVIKNFIEYPEGSVLIEFGKTKVICNATVENKVPPFLKGENQGWLTAEYEMLPRSTQTRMKRDKFKVNGRIVEIQRLIGRSLRAALDLKKLGERTITIDCDVIQADGGTRTASITGGYLALEIAINKLMQENILTENPLVSKIAAISVGKIQNEFLLDLEYSEDSIAEVDMNIVKNDKNEYIEIQGTGENNTFSKEDLMKFLEISEKSFEELFKL